MRPNAPSPLLARLRLAAIAAMGLLLLPSATPTAEDVTPSSPYGTPTGSEGSSEPQSALALAATLPTSDVLPSGLAHLHLILRQGEGEPAYEREEWVPLDKTVMLFMPGLPLVGPTEVEATLEEGDRLWRTCAPVLVTLAPSTVPALRLQMCEHQTVVANIDALSWAVTLTLGADQVAFLDGLHHPQYWGTLRACEGADLDVRVPLLRQAQGEQAALIWPEEEAVALTAGAQCTFGVHIEDTGVERLIGETRIVAQPDAQGGEMLLTVSDPWSHGEVDWGSGLIAFDIQEISPYLDGGGWIPEPSYFLESRRLSGGSSLDPLGREGDLLLGFLPPQQSGGRLLSLKMHSGERLLVEGSALLAPGETEVSLVLLFAEAPSPSHPLMARWTPRVRRRVGP